MVKTFTLKRNDKMLLPYEQPENVKAYMLKILNTVERPGTDKLLDYLLNKSDYFTSRASIKHHMNVTCGLLYHSFRLHILFNESNKRTRLLSQDSVNLCPALHDLCKADSYKTMPNGEIWYANDGDKRHATLSLEKIKKFITLTEEEEAIIRYHMGLFYCHQTGNGFTEYPVKDMHNAIARFPSVQIFAACDMEVSRWDVSSPYWQSDAWKLMLESNMSDVAPIKPKTFALNAKLNQFKK